MKTQTFLLAWLASLSASGAFATPLADQKVNKETKSLDEIYKAAQSESGTLTVAWGGDIKLAQQAIISAFEERFPKIKLNLTVDFSKYWDGRIDRAYLLSQGKDNGADVAILQSLQDFPRWKDERRLLNYKLARWDDIYSEFKDGDGAYTGLYTFTFGNIVHKSSQNTSLPTTFTDFLDPKYSNGQLVLTYPNDDDAVLYLFTRIVDKYGWDYIYSLARQNVTWVRGSATPSMLISRSNSTGPNFSFTSWGAYAEDVTDSLPNDVYMSWPQTGAIFKTTKNPETAKLFLNFLADDKWQDAIQAFSGFATRRSRDKLHVFDQKPRMDAVGFYKFMEDRAKVDRYKVAFEDILGTARGINPNYIDW